MTDSSRLDDLESRVAFQDDAIRALNEVIATQDRQLLNMQTELNALKTRLRELIQSVGDSTVAPASEETPPPHY